MLLPAWRFAPRHTARGATHAKPPANVAPIPNEPKHGSGLSQAFASPRHAHHAPPGIGRPLDMVGGGWMSFADLVRKPREQGKHWVLHRVVPLSLRLLFAILKHQEVALRVAQRICRTQRTAVVVVLHDLNLASAWSDRIVLMKSGRLVRRGLPSQVLTTSALRQVYDVDVLCLPHPTSGRPIVIAGSGGNAPPSSH